VKQAVVVERAMRQQRSARMLCERVRDRQVRHHASRHLLFEYQSHSFLLLNSNRILLYFWVDVDTLPTSVLLARRSNI
jgi:hypothetical protein